MDRPNFILFVTDQHRADHLGCYGNSVVQTPNIDRIAARGLRFDRFYVATAICMPNRATLMTGRMPSLHGVRHNGIPLSFRNNTFVDVLRQGGYRTALIGKSHLQNMTEDRPMVRATAPAAPGFAEATKDVLDDPRYEQETPEAWSHPDHRIAVPHYGFDHVDYCGDHSDRVFGDYSRWLAERAGDAEKLCGPENALPAGDAYGRLPQAWRTRVPTELYPTSYIAERSVAYLEGAARRGNDRPFFMTCSFPDPHHPFTPPGRYWDMYDPRAMTAPATCRPPDAEAPPHLRWLHAQRALGNLRTDGPSVFVVDEGQAREAIALTYGMISMIDDAIGRVLTTLAATGLAANTIVAFTSDHGDFMGDHGLMLKGPLHYQGLIRVPFLWADPADPRKAAHSDLLSGTVDIARTVLTRAGLTPYHGMQGGDIIDLARHYRALDERSMLLEEEGQRTFLGFDRPVKMRTLVTRRHRLSLYQGASWGELYDLETDPEELDNRWDDPRCRVLRGELLEQMARKLVEATDASPLPTRLA